MLENRCRAFAEINLDHLVHNFELVKELAGGCKICSVVKADAYGHGAPTVAKKLSACGSDWFGVSNLDEALQLRRAGIKEPILIFGYTPPEGAAELIDHDLTQCVFSLSYAGKLAAAAAACGGTVSAHIKIDTGMSRLGVVYQNTSRIEEALEEVKAICSEKNLRCSGIFTHFADASDVSGLFTRMQYNRFMELITRLEKEGITFELRHCSASAGVLNFPKMSLDMIRPGIVLYGFHPDGGKLRDGRELKPVMEFKSVISLIKEIEAGATVSYGRTFKSAKTMRIATLPFGYADGYPRQLSNSADVLIAGRRAPVIGRVCMDQLMVDVSKIEEAKEGDEAVIFGRSGEGAISCEELATLSDTISYEILCGIGKRVPRIYLEGGEKTGVQYDIV